MDTNHDVLKGEFAVLGVGFFWERFSEGGIEEFEELPGCVHILSGNNPSKNTFDSFSTSKAKEKEEKPKKRQKKETKGKEK